MTPEDLRYNWNHSHVRRQPKKDTTAITVKGGTPEDARIYKAFNANDNRKPTEIKRNSYSIEQQQNTSKDTNHCNGKTPEGIEKQTFESNDKTPEHVLRYNVIHNQRSDS